MRMLGVWVSWIIAMACGSAWAGSSGIVASFCEDPYQAVCGTTNDAHDYQKATGSMTRVLTRVYERLGPVEIGGVLRAPSLSVRSAFAFAPSEAQAAQNIRYMRVLEEEMFREMGVSVAEWSAVIREVRSDLIASIRKTTALNAKTRSDMIERVRTVRILSPYEFTSAFARTMHAGDFFGETGLVMNAFYLPSEHALTFVPGFFFYAISRVMRPDPRVLLDFFRHVAAHEIGHAIDGNRYSRTYAKMSDCVREHFRDEMPRERWLYFFEGAVPEAQMRKSIGEITADYWSVRALTESFVRRGFTAKRAVGEIRRSFGFFCSAPETMAHGDVHPGARFRIGLSMGRDPGLRAFLGCAPQPARAPGCGLVGAVR